MKDITIHPQATIKEAMEALDKTAEKVLLVVDENKVLIGCLTDGDIRRYILKGRDLTSVIEDAYKANPVFVFQEDFDPEKIKAVFLKNKINVIPILDQNRKVINFITWGKGVRKQQKAGEPKTGCIFRKETPITSPISAFKLLIIPILVKLTLSSPRAGVLGS